MREVMQTVNCLAYHVPVAPTIRPKALTQLAATRLPRCRALIARRSPEQIARNDAELAAALTKVRERTEALLGTRGFCWKECARRAPHRFPVARRRLPQHRASQGTCCSRV